MYRHGIVLTRLVEADLAKEEAGESWDLDKAEKRATDARSDLVGAAKAVPTDKSIRAALEELQVLRKALRVHRQNYRKDQKELYSSFISNLDKDNARITEAEEQGLLKDLPPLEKIRIA